MPARSVRSRRAWAAPVVAMLAAATVAARSGATDPATSPAAAAREARIARQLSTNPDAAPSLADWSLGLPAFDARYGPDGQPVAAAAAPLVALAGLPAWEARRAEVRKLAAGVPELRVDDHAVFGTPEFVRSTSVFLTAPAPTTAPADVVAAFIHDHAALFEINALEIPAARVEREFTTDHNGVMHLTFQQQVRGVDLFGCQVRANVMPDGRLINISSTMLPRPVGNDGDFAVPAHVISAADALIAAARTAGVELSGVPLPAEPAAGASQRTVFATPAELRTGEPVVTERVYFPFSRTDIRAAYSVVISVPGAGHTYDIIVDAADGSLLWRSNRLWWDSTQPVTLRVYTSDGIAPMSPALAAPGNTQAPLATRELVTMQPADVIAFSPNGWINDNDTQTLGNNIDAHLDLDSNDVADTPRPDGGAMRVFDFPMDPSLDPSTYRQAAVAQLFYLGNRFHDRLYAMGFNEAAGNFQAVNFTAAGLGNDRIQADAQDGMGIAPNQNNANFSTQGTDGSAARMQMYLFTGPIPDRDGAFDAEIVYHELAHGLSIRLHGANGLMNVQSRGLGEGWSDYFAFSLLAEPGDDPDGNYATGPYTIYKLAPGFESNYYFGFRRFPYSSNLNVSPLTFADIDQVQYANPPTVPISPLVGVAISINAGEEHNIGEVWCNMLMECRAELWRRDGFSANQLTMQLVVDGMKLSPANPSFLQARDSILQADLVNNAGVNRAPLWAAFAKRGLGSGAVSLSSSSTTVVQDFQTPFNVQFQFPDGVPTRLNPGVTNSFRVRLIPSLVTLTPGTQTLSYRVNGGQETVAPLVPTGTPNEYTATFPPLACFDRVGYVLHTDASYGSYSSPTTGTYNAVVYTQSSTVADDAFEAETGWSVGPNTASSGLWVRDDPVGTSIQPEDDHTADPGSACWFTGQGAPGGPIGAADVDGGYTTLTSPVYDLAGAADAVVSYWRWYSNGSGGAPYADTFRIDVSTNSGATWTNAQTIGPGSVGDPDANPGWRSSSWSFRDLGLTPTAQVRIRFVADDAGSGSFVEAAVDDFRIEVPLCQEPPPCPADFNRSGTVTVQDIFDFLTAYFTFTPAADINHSGSVTVQDIFDFLTAYFAGCP